MRIALLATLAACSAPAPPPTTPPSTGAGSATVPPPDARVVTEDERLAAIQLAMNQLDETVQVCWAAVAARERFDIAGSVKVLIEILERDGATGGATGGVTGGVTGGAIDDAHPSAKATVVEDTTQNARLSSCVANVMTLYPWAPPLFGQTIQLPFEFNAPVDGQNVIDRALVGLKGQGAVEVGVLIDAANSGNDDLSLFDVKIGANRSTGMRVAERDEVWFFRSPATIAAVGKGGVAVVAGDMAFVPKGGAREIKAAGQDVIAVLAMTPGGREGSARMGALPTQELTAVRAAPVGATVFPASGAKTYGPATIYIEPATLKGTKVAAEVLTLAPNAKIAEHVHANETEVLYVLDGGGVMTVNGTRLVVTKTSVVQIPPNTKHAVESVEGIRAVQFYTPAGPEQRFKKQP